MLRHRVNDRARTAAIAAEIRNAFDQGRKVQVLTERTERLDAIQLALVPSLRPLSFFTGRC